MKRIFAAIFFVLFLTGCGENSELNQVMAFRERILTSEGCMFQANIIADYGDAVYAFSVKCTFDQTGAMTFTVLSPETINGITGSIKNEQGALTFDDQVLLFELLADDQITPISAPWLIIKALRSGYLQSCGPDGEYIRIIMDDSYASNALQVELWVTAEMTPVAADISWKNRRILAMEITSFSYL